MAHCSIQTIHEGGIKWGLKLSHRGRAPVLDDIPRDRLALHLRAISYVDNRKLPPGPLGSKIQI